MGKFQCSTCKSWVSEYSGKCQCGMDGFMIRNEYQIVQDCIDSGRFSEEESYPQYWLCEKCNGRNVFKTGDYKSQRCTHCGSAR